jgi:membrane associated rhomboid family serine protease
MTSAAKLPYKTLDPPPPKPVLTVLLICLMPLCLAPDNLDWIDRTAFTASHAAELLHDAKYIDVLSYMFTAAFAQLTQWMWVFNSLFIWTFGHVIEKKLKTIKYAILLPLLVISGWILILVQPGSMEKMYIGPSMFLFGLLGAYFANFPKQETRIQTWVKPNTQIFRVEKQASIEERYWVSPWNYVTAFVIFQIILQIGLNFSKDAIVDRTNLTFLGTLHTYLFGRLQSNPSAFQPIAAIMNIFVGYVIAQMLPMIQKRVKPIRPGGKLQLEVIQHYRELRTLDLTHDQACEGAAKFAAVPIDIAKDWIAKGSAGLKDQEIR